MRELTKAEAELMRILWRLKRAYVKDVLAELPDPKPAYNTVSTFIRILEKKGMVGYTPYGKTHEYFPLISEEEYKRFETKQLLRDYFGNSLPNLVSFFVNDQSISPREADELIDLINRQKKS